MAARGNWPDGFNAVLPSGVNLIVLVHHWVAMRHDELELVAYFVSATRGLVSDRTELVGAGVVGEPRFSNDPRPRPVQRERLRATVRRERSGEIGVDHGGEHGQRREELPEH